MQILCWKPKNFIPSCAVNILDHEISLNSKCWSGNAIKLDSILEDDLKSQNSCESVGDSSHGGMI